ncbi:MAG: hypothetical protein IPP90_23790 [Gemmatimonadaceae bacterium]|nr:hypothetical protein [Gemmatimonadaceae bacterium]
MSPVDVTVGPALYGGRERYVNDEGLAIELLVGLRRPRARLMYAAAGGQGRCRRGFAASGSPCRSTPVHPACANGSSSRLPGGRRSAPVGEAVSSSCSTIDLLRRPSRGTWRTASERGRGAPRVALTVGVNGNWLALSNGSSLRYYASAFGLRLQ